MLRGVCLFIWLWSDSCGRSTIQTAHDLIYDGPRFHNSTTRPPSKTMAPYSQLEDIVHVTRSLINLSVVCNRYASHRCPVTFSAGSIPDFYDIYILITELDSILDIRYLLLSSQTCPKHISLLFNRVDDHADLL